MLTSYWSSSDGVSSYQMIPELENTDMFLQICQQTLKMQANKLAILIKRWEDKTT
uniref:Uncharacterized protein n=1 Tax=Arundo donax TaxID=35708 RepID=A0A0A9ATA8_ARUDO